MQHRRLILFVLGFIVFIQVDANSTNSSTDHHKLAADRAQKIAEDYMQQIGRKTNRDWKIKRSGTLVQYGDFENCSGSTTDKPLCTICERVMNQTCSPEEMARLSLASFIHGILTFPNTNFPQQQIDIVMCTYNPSIGIARFYLTRGKEENSAYFVNNAGNIMSECKFTLHGNYVTWKN